MIAIRGNFFYTRTVPCELWFLNKAQPKKHQGKVLMIDARSIYRKVTRKIYDFSSEQLKNLTSIVWLYRGDANRFVKLIAEHLANSIAEGTRSVAPVHAFMESLAEARSKTADLSKSAKDETTRVAFSEFERAVTTLGDDIEEFAGLVKGIEAAWTKETRDLPILKAFLQRTEKSAEASHDLVRDIDHVAKLFSRAVDLAEKELSAKENGIWSARDARAAQKALEQARSTATEQLKQVRYFYRHAHWLSERFPDAELRDVPGLVKLVSHDELDRHDWSLTPGRYVGVAPEQEDEDFDFEETMREIHVELVDLNGEAAQLAAKISENFKALGI